MTTFTWRGRELEIFDHGHNATRTNERGAELAIARLWLQGVPLNVGLELGNVLSHYDDAGPWPRRTIVDRYEKGRGVENLDVFDIAGEFDWILSVSTLEHVRLDEDLVNPMGAVAALHYLRGLLKPAGKMLVTVPLGVNTELDRELRSARTGARASTLVRLRGSWFQTDAFTSLPYGPTEGANAVWIGTWGDE